MRTIRNLMCLFSVAGFAACTNETFVEEQTLMESGSDAIIKEITVTLPEILSDANTRTVFDMSEDGVTATWAKGDTIGIFPSKGGQVEFPTISGAGSNTAVFDGGDWGLKVGRSYAAYFPFNKWNVFRDKKSILLDYTGQTQKGNGNAAHLGAYDFLATGQVSPNASGYLDLEMERLGSIVMLELGVPKAGTYTSLTLTSSSAKFVSTAELDISGKQPLVTAKTTSASITLALDNVTLTEDGQTLTAYLMCAPIDLTAGTLKVSLSGDSNYNMELTPKDIEAGKPYQFSGTFEQVVGNIDFADPEVKRICVEHWDTNGDGELSYDEAAVVTSLKNPNMWGSYFSGNLNITSFDELQYFTGLTAIEDCAFVGCNNLSSIVFSETISYIGESAFMGGYLRGDSYNEVLTSVVFPNSLRSIGRDAFKNCINLSSITFNEGLESIGNSAFAASDANTSLTTITLPNSLKTIGDYAFHNYAYLHSVSLPEGLVSIGKYAFAYGFMGQDGPPKGNLANIEIPSTVTSIGECAFLNSKISSMTIPDGLSVIDYVLARCWNLRSVTIPEGVTSMKGSFSGCERLASVSIPNSVTDIDYAFESCTRLTSVEVPENVVSMKGAFMYCSNLVSVNIPEGVTSLNGTFSGCSKLTSVDIPDNVVDISNAFSGCVELNNIILPESLTSIGSSAFYNCRALTNIVLPENLTTIGNSAFSECSQLTTINISDKVKTIESHAFSSCYSLLNISLPEGLTTIGSMAFYNTGLTSITLPPYLSLIDDQAFLYCWSMSSITSLATTAPLLGNRAFDGTNDAPIYVPSASLESYKDDWFEYADRIQAITE